MFGAETLPREYHILLIVEPGVGDKSLEPDEMGLGIAGMKKIQMLYDWNMITDQGLTESPRGVMVSHDITWT